MSSFSEDVHEFVSFAEDSGNLSLNINKFTILIGLVARVRCARRLLSCTGYAMLTCSAHLVTWIRTRSRGHDVVGLVDLARHILDACVYGVILFLLLCGAS